MLCEKCKEQKTTGALAVRESLTGLEDLRLSKKNIYSLPVPHTVAEDISALFFRREISIWKEFEQKRWKQWYRPLTDSQVLGVMSNEGRGLYRGCYFGRETRYGVLDIDKGSQYHCQEALTKLLQQFSLLGLELTPYQSSESGGWHLYFFFSSFVLSQEVESSIKRWLKVQGYELACGTLEVFPSGNALRLPLQKDFGWLDSDGKLVRKREELTADEAISSFLSDLTKTQANWEVVRSSIESQISETRAAAGITAQEHRERVSADGLEELYRSGRDHETYQRGRNYWLNGLTGASQRHSAILSVGHYLWYGDPSQGVKELPGIGNAGARVEAISQWLKEKHNGQSETINSGRWHEVQSDIENACYWTPKDSLVRERERYPLTDRLVDRLCETKVLLPDDYAKANRRREGAARSKIRTALNQMLAEGKHPTIRNLAEATGCRRETVKKHSDIWAIYATRIETRMSTGLGDLSGGAGGIFGVPPSVLVSSANSFDQSVLVESCSESVVEIFPCGLADSFDCSLGSELIVSRPVSERALAFGSSEALSGSKWRISHESLSDSNKVLGISGSDSFALSDGVGEILNFPVSPFAHAWQTSQPESPLNQAQVLRMPFIHSQVRLTKGPRLSGIQALRHGQAGGLFSISPVCYSTGITSGTRERGQATAETGSLSYLPGNDPEIPTVSDAINSIFLTTRFNGSGTGLEDKILTPFSDQKNAEGLESQGGQAIELEPSDSISSPLFPVYSRYCFDTG